MKRIASIVLLLCVTIIAVLFIFCSKDNAGQLSLYPQKVVLKKTGEIQNFYAQGGRLKDYVWFLEDSTKGTLTTASKNASLFKSTRPGTNSVYVTDGRDTCKAVIEVVTTKFQLPPQLSPPENPPLQFSDGVHPTPHRVLGSPIKIDRLISSKDEAEVFAQNFLEQTVSQLPRFGNFLSQNTVNHYQTIQTRDSTFYVNYLQQYNYDNNNITVFNTNAQVVLKKNKLLQYGINFFQIDSLKNEMRITREHAVNFARQSLNNESVDYIQSDLVILAALPYYYLAYKVELSYWEETEKPYLQRTEKTYKTTAFFIDASKDSILMSFHRQHNVQVYGEQPFKFLNRAIGKNYPYHGVFSFSQEIQSIPREHNTLKYHLQVIADYFQKYYLKPKNLIITYTTQTFNALYAPPNRLIFGSGVDDITGDTINLSRFSDVIYHEFTHSIVDNYMYKNMYPSFPIKAINEALADFWACLINSELPGNDKVVNSEGVIDFVYRDLTNQSLKIDKFVQLDGFEHSNSLILSATLWNIRDQLLQKYNNDGRKVNELLADRIIKAMLTSPSTIELFGSQLVVADQESGNLYRKIPHLYEIRKSFNKVGIELNNWGDDWKGPQVISDQSHIECKESGELAFTFTDSSDIDINSLLLKVDGNNIQINEQNILCLTPHRYKLILPYRKTDWKLDQEVTFEISLIDVWGNDTDTLITAPYKDSLPPKFRITNKRSTQNDLCLTFDLTDACSGVDGNSSRIQVNGDEIIPHNNAICIPKAIVQNTNCFDLSIFAMDKAGNSLDTTFTSCVSMIEFKFIELQISEKKHVFESGQEEYDYWDVMPSVVVNKYIYKFFEWYCELNGYNCQDNGLQITNPDIFIEITINNSSRYHNRYQLAVNFLHFRWNDPVWQTSGDDTQISRIIAFDDDAMQIKVYDLDPVIDLTQFLNHGLNFSQYPQKFELIGQWSGSVNDLKSHSADKLAVDGYVESFTFELR